MEHEHGNHHEHDDDDSSTEGCNCGHGSRETGLSLVRLLDMLNIDDIELDNEVPSTPEITNIEEYSTPERPVSAKFLEKLDACKEDILTSTLWEPYRVLLNKAMDDVSIDKIVVLAMNGFWIKAGSGERALLRWFYELATVLVIKEFARSRSGKTEEIPIYFQDPAFCEGDDRILSALGGVVVKAPGARDIIDANTFLFANALWIDEIYNTICLSDPGIYLGSTVDSLFTSLEAYRTRQYQLERGEEPGSVQETVMKWLQMRNFEVPDNMIFPDSSDSEDEDDSDDEDDDDKEEDEDEHEYAHQHDHYDSNIIFVDMVLYTLAPNGKPARSAESIQTYADQSRKQQFDEELDYSRRQCEADGVEYDQSCADATRMLREAIHAAYDLDMWYEGWYDRNSQVSEKFRAKLDGTKEEVRSNDNWLPYRTQLRKVLNDAKTKIDKVVMLGLGTYYKSVVTRADMEEWFHETSVAFVTAEIVFEWQGQKARLILMSQDDEDERNYDEHERMFNVIGGVEIVKVHEAQSYIGPNTLVRSMLYNSAPDRSEGSLLDSPPAIYIGQSLERFFVEDLESEDKTASGNREKAISFIKSHASEPMVRIVQPALNHWRRRDMDPRVAFFGDDEVIAWFDNERKVGDFDVDAVVKRVHEEMEADDEMFDAKVAELEDQNS